MSALVDAVAALGGTSDAFGTPTVDVEPERWTEALRTARDAGAEFFDLLTAYDDEPAGFAVVAHVASADLHEHVLLRTRVPAAAPVLDSATAVYPGAAWHERETHEMFGIGFAGNDRLDNLLVDPALGVHPLRKDVLLEPRLQRAWPGAKDPADSGGRSRRPLLPPGVPAEGHEVGR